MLTIGGRENRNGGQAALPVPITLTLAAMPLKSPPLWLLGLLHDGQHREVDPGKTVRWFSDASELAKS